MMYQVCTTEIFENSYTFQKLNTQGDIGVKIHRVIGVKQGNFNFDTPIIEEAFLRVSRRMLVDR